jgi:amino acid transporter
MAAGLKRTLDFSTLILLAINGIIGTGIFFVPAIAAGIAGPASYLSWIGVAILAIFIAWHFAELAGMYDRSGGVFEYSKAAFGEFPGFVVGWISWVVSNITIAMLVLGAIDYISQIVPVPAYSRLIVALAYIFFVNFISYRGLNIGIKILLSFAIVTIISLWIIISFGVYYIDITNLTPFFVTPKFAILFAMVFIMETFFGWETVTFLSEETKDAKKIIPKALMLGTVLVVLLALSVVIVSLGTLHWKVLAASIAPLATVAESFGGPKFSLMIALLTTVNILGTAAAWIITTPRLVFALGREKLLPPLLSKVHPKYGTPYYAILFQTILSSFIILSGSYKFLLHVLLPLAIFMYSVVILSVAKLRFSQPKIKRAIKVPFGKLLPFALVAIMLYLASLIEADIILAGVLFTLLGIPLYIFMGLAYQPKVMKYFFGITTRLSAVTYPLYVSKKTFNNLTDYIKGSKTIFNFGCDVGKLARHLALQFPKSQVIASEISEHELEHAKKISDKEHIRNIKFILESAERRHNFHKNIKKVDAVVSIDLLGYLINPVKVLKSLKTRMKPGAKFYFVEFDKIFRILSAKDWLQEDKKIRDTFKKAGFQVKVEREKRLLWEFIHVKGKKK